VCDEHEKQQQHKQRAESMMTDGKMMCCSSEDGTIGSPHYSCEDEDLLALEVRNSANVAMATAQSCFVETTLSGSSSSFVFFVEKSIGTVRR